jgi:F-type H+-transporting ATPase subunit delta
MAELSTLARPYAKAAFQFALANDQLHVWSTQLSVASAIVGDATVAKVLDSPSYTAEHLAATVVGVAGDSLGVEVQNFVSVIAENKRLALLPEISSLFEQFKASQEQSVDIEVVSPYELGEATQQKLSDALAVKLNRSVNVSTTLDASLIGGVLIRAGDTVIDGSVRGRLNKLTEAMNS